MNVISANVLSAWLIVVLILSAFRDVMFLPQLVDVSVLIVSFLAASRVFGFRRRTFGDVWTRILGYVPNVLLALGFFFAALYLSRYLSFSADSKGDVDFILKQYSPASLGHLHAWVVLLLVSVQLTKQKLFLNVLRVFGHPIRFLCGVYVVGAFCGALALLLPFSVRAGASLSLVDAFFLSVSAISVTGLSPVDVSSVLSLFGLSVLMVLIQLGGLGIVTFGFVVLGLFGKRLSLDQGQATMGLFDVGGHHRLGPFLKQLFLVAFAIEGVGALMIYTALPSDLEHRWFHAAFHAVSAFCNAGFSSLPGGLESPGLYVAKVFIIVLVALGGLGFPVLAFLFFRFRSWLWSRPYPTIIPSSHQLGLVVTVSLWIGGALALTAFEWAVSANFSQALSALPHAIFQSVSARTAGFSSIPTVSLSVASQFTIMLLMVVGASPLSTGGGIKTTTFGVLVASAVSYLRGRNATEACRAEVHQVQVMKSISILFIYFILIVASVLVLSVFESVDAWRLSFESISALSTVGLSLGVTPELSFVGKLWVCSLMMIGRLGLLLVVAAGVGGTVSAQRFRYPRDEFQIG